MKKRVKKLLTNLITIIIIIALIMILIEIRTPKNTTTEEIAKCIGDKSTLYTQLGCHACETQEKMFGENYQYLNVIDCFYERDKCDGIEATPTWEIKGERHQGVQEIEILQELTNCN